MILASIFN